MIKALTAVAYLLKDITAVVSLLMIMRYIFLNEIKRRKALGCIFLAFIIANSVIGAFFLSEMTPDYKAIMDAVSNVIYLLSLRLMTDCRKLSRCIWLLLIYIVTAEMFYSLISPYTNDILWIECITYFVIFSLVCAALLFSAGRSEINFLPKVFEEIPKWIYVVILLFELTCYYKEFGASHAWYNVLYIVSSATVILCVLYLVFKIFYLAHQQNAILQQMSIQKEFSEQAINSDEELRKFRHDYKNHMIVVNAYLENGNTDKAREYLRTMSGGIYGAVSKIRTGNFVADAILNTKNVLASRSNTVIKFTGFIPNEGIADNDLCTIISNLVDNAIEGVAGVSDERIITVSANIKNGFFILGVSNPTANQIKRSNGAIVTSKQDKRSHGIGLKSIEQRVKKYKGVLTTSLENGVFSADIRMKI